MSGAKWPVAKVQRLIELYSQGRTPTQIAELMQITISSAEGRLGRLREKGLLSDAVRRRGPRRSIIHDRPCTAPYAPDSSTPRFANDDAHVAACLRLGGFPVLEVRYV